MNRPLLMLLAAVLAATLYLTAQSDADVEPAVQAQRPAPSAKAAMAPPKRGAEPRAAVPAFDQQRVAELLNLHLDQMQQSKGAAPHVRPPVRDGGWGSAAARPLRNVQPVVLSPEPDAQSIPAVAPSFPYRWLGNMSMGAAGGEAADKQAILAGTERTMVVGVGQKLDESWRLDAIKDASLAVTFLPSNQTQTVWKK